MGATPTLWYADWAWSLPLIVVTVLIHVLGLGLFNERVIPALGVIAPGHQTAAFIVVMSATVLFATFLHGLEGAIWAGAYLVLGALPDPGSAMLYSLSSMTAYGHAPVFLAHHWQLMGALEALNGIILFGLTTAFLFSKIQRVWALGRAEQPPYRPSAPKGQVSCTKVRLSIQRPRPIIGLDANTASHRGDRGGRREHEGSHASNVDPGGVRLGGLRLTGRRSCLAAVA